MIYPPTLSLVICHQHGAGPHRNISTSLTNYFNYTLFVPEVRCSAPKLLVSLKRSSHYPEEIHLTSLSCANVTTLELVTPFIVSIVNISWNILQIHFYIFLEHCSLNTEFRIKNIHQAPTWCLTRARRGCDLLMLIQLLCCGSNVQYIEIIVSRITYILPTSW